MYAFLEAVLDWFSDFFSWIQEEETIEQMKETAELYAKYTSIVRTML